MFWNGLVACSLIIIVSLVFFLWCSLHMSPDLTTFSISLFISFQYTLFLVFNRHFSKHWCTSWILFRNMFCMLFGIRLYSPMYSPLFAYVFAFIHSSILHWQTFFQWPVAFYGFRNVFYILIITCFSIFNSSSASAASSKSACFCADIFTVCILRSSSVSSLCVGCILHK